MLTSVITVRGLRAYACLRDYIADAIIAWTPWLPEYATFNSVGLALLNIIFSYSFTVCQYAFMAEMHTPTDFQKSLVALGGLEITVYTYDSCP